MNKKILVLVTLISCMSGAASAVSYQMMAGIAGSIALIATYCVAEKTAVKVSKQGETSLVLERSSRRLRSTTIERVTIAFGTQELRDKAMKLDQKGLKKMFLAKQEEKEAKRKFSDLGKVRQLTSKEIENVHKEGKKFFRSLSWAS